KIDSGFSSTSSKMRWPRTSISFWRELISRGGKFTPAAVLRQNRNTSFTGGFAGHDTGGCPQLVLSGKLGLGPRFGGRNRLITKKFSRRNSFGFRRGIECEWPLWTGGHGHSDGSVRTNRCPDQMRVHGLPIPVLALIF